MVLQNSYVEQKKQDRHFEDKNINKSSIVKEPLGKSEEKKDTKHESASKTDSKKDASKTKKVETTGVSLESKITEMTKKEPEVKKEEPKKD